MKLTKLGINPYGITDGYYLYEAGDETGILVTGMSLKTHTRETAIASLQHTLRVIEDDKVNGRHNSRGIKNLNEKQEAIRKTIAAIEQAFPQVVTA